MRAPLLVGMLVTATTLWAGYSYGDTVTVENMFGMIISPGWVVIRESYSGPTIANPKFPTKTFMTLTNLNGGAVGDTLEVSGISPIPAGWAIISQSGDKGLEKLSYNIRYKIEKQFSADATGSEERPPVTQGKVELDVASLDFKKTKRIDGSLHSGPNASELLAIAKAKAEAEAAVAAKVNATAGAESWAPLSERKDKAPGS